jgi:hypothetical protein
MTTETRTSSARPAPKVIAGFKGLRIDTRYTGVVQDDGTVLVALVGAMVGNGVTVSSGVGGLRNN